MCLSTALDFVAAHTAAKQAHKLLVVQFYKPWTCETETTVQDAGCDASSPPAFTREFIEVATDPSLTELAIFKVIGINSTTMSWAHTIAGDDGDKKDSAPDNGNGNLIPSRHVPAMCNKVRGPGSPHSKKQLQEVCLS